MVKVCAKPAASIVVAAPARRGVLQVAGGTDGFGGVSPDEDAISSQLEVLVIAGEKPTAYKRPGATQRGDPYPRGYPPKPLLQPISRPELYHLSFKKFCLKDRSQGWRRYLADGSREGIQSF